MMSHCSRCGGERKHRVFHRHHDEGVFPLVTTKDEHVGDQTWSEDYWMLQCMGCDAVTLRRDVWDDIDNETVTTYFPPPSSREMPAWMKTDDFKEACPPSIRELLREAYVSFQNECDRGVAMCVRAILEAAMIDKCGDQGTFAKNLEVFIEHGHLLPKQKELLEPVIEAGSAAIHRDFKPTREQLAVILDLTETALATAYYHPARAAALKARIPKRM